MEAGPSNPFTSAVVTSFVDEMKAAYFAGRTALAAGISYADAPYEDTLAEIIGTNPAGKLWRCGWLDELATRVLGTPIVCNAFRRDKDSDEAGAAAAAEEGGGA